MPVQRKRLTRDEKDFYDLLIERTRKYNKMFHDDLNVDDPDDDIEVYFFDVPTGYGQEMWEEAFVDIIYDSLGKIKNLDYNGTKSINLSQSTTAAFRRLYKEWGSTIQEDNPDWRGEDWDSYHYWITETSEYRKIEQREKAEATKMWWEDNLRRTPLQDKIPEEYFFDPDYCHWTDQSMDSVEWMEGERGWHVPADDEAYIIWLAAHKALEDGDLEDVADEEELEHILMDYPPWNDPIEEKCAITGHTAKRKDMLHDNGLWYYIPALLERQQVQGYGNSIIQAIRLRIAEFTELYALTFNLNFCAIERTYKTYQTHHEIMVWCPAFKLIFSSTTRRMGFWQQDTVMMCQSVVSFPPYTAEINSQYIEDTRITPLVRAFQNWVLPDVYLTPGLLTDRIEGVERHEAIAIPSPRD
jgi:hypothetical protein